jgi:hypothetical protein
MRKKMSTSLKRTSGAAAANSVTAKDWTAQKRPQKNLAAFGAALAWADGAC